MASSHEILVSPQELPAEPGQRERWADNLRVLVIAVVVVWHTAESGGVMADVTPGTRSSTITTVRVTPTRSSSW